MPLTLIQSHDSGLARFGIQTLVTLWNRHGWLPHVDISEEAVRQFRDERPREAFTRAHDQQPRITPDPREEAVTRSAANTQRLTGRLANPGDGI